MDVNPRDPRDLRDREIKRTAEGGVRVSRPMEPRDEEMEADERGTTTVDYSSRSRRSSKGPWILVLAIVIVLAVLGVVFRDKVFTKISSKVGIVSGFQAVFLTNGQVYFGKLSDAEEKYVKMEDIYYLQVTPVLQTKTEGQPGSQAATDQQQQQQLSLVKLGNELHGPMDKMFINRDQILFIETLKDDGKVMQAIKDYESGAKK